MKKKKITKQIKQPKQKNINKFHINKNWLIIGIISLLILIIGSFALGFFVSLIFVIIMDTIVFLFLHKKGKGKKKEKKTVWQIILLVMFTFGILILLFMVAFFIWIAKTAKPFDPKELYQKESTIVYDANGEIIAKLGAQKRENISYDEIPEVLIDAIIATEDSRFFQHNGFDLPRFIKATLGQLAGNKDAGGASTLTMQLSKNIYTSTEDEGIDGIIRKFTDIYMSIFKIEKNYTKQEILEFYVNSNLLGGASRGGAYGVEQASLIYFGKSAKELNLSEAALIAGLFNSPNALDPLKYPEKAAKRRSVVLYLMELHGYITNEEREIANSIPVESLITKDYVVNDYQSFIDTVVEEVKDKTKRDPVIYPMAIYTTMNKEKQEHVNKVMNGELFTWDNDKAQAGVIVLDTKTGAILAVGANRSSDAKVYNYATMIEKQIGSTAKPLYDYGPAIEYNNWNTGYLIADEPSGYTNGPAVNNWNGTFDGLMTMRVAIMGSRNIPALKTFKAMNNNNIKEFVTNLGLSPEIESGKVHEAHAIGGYNGESPLTLAAAYATFGNKGVYNEPYSFTKVIFRDTNEEYVNKTATKKVMGEDTAYMMTSILIDTAPSALLQYGKFNNATVAAKTGTTNFSKETLELYPKLVNDYRGAVNDLWVAGYDPNYTMALWYGYDGINQENVDNGYYNTVQAFTHAKLYYTLGKGIYTDTDKFTQPNNVKSVAIEKDTFPAKLPSDYTPKDMIITELFKEGTEPTEVSTRYSKLDDVKNLDSKQENNTLTLSWDAIKTPDGINEEEIMKFYKTMFSDEAFRKIYYDARIKYNKDVIGDVIYNVYYKDKDDKLVLIDSTKENKLDINLKSPSGSITYVVKTSYSIFKSNISDGASITVEFKKTESLITSSLIGDSEINLNLNDTYDSKNYVIITEEALDVTKDATIETIIKNSKDEIVDNIDTTKEETYTITYKISYKDYTNTLSRIVKIK